MKQLTVRVSEKLRELGIGAHYRGFGYLKSAIMMIFEEPRSMMRLYKDVGEEYYAEPTSVERCIRTAIRSSKTPYRSSSEFIWGLVEDLSCEVEEEDGEK